MIGGRIAKNPAGKRFMGFLAILPIAAAFGIGVQILMQMLTVPSGERTAAITVGNWITMGSISIPFEFLVDPLSISMVLIITGIGSLIHLYATGYMAEEKDYARFFTYLNLFVGFMLILVLGRNMVLTFVGWEGVGLCSYLLIGFWYKDLNNSRAANKAFIVNRIGDWGMSLGMFMLAVLVACCTGKGVLDNRFLSYDVLQTAEKATHVFSSHPGVTTAICLLLFVGAMGKSAQFPLYLWLPDAMAGPTPVSALIHAATMVTAGVFLLNRMSWLFVLSPTAGAVIAVIGGFTALFAALIAFGQTDIKKVLAYSTVSQLGYMFIGCGSGAYWTGMFHVTTHAFFKALLFLGSGAVIHAMVHEQDMRNYGKLAKYIKVTFLTMFIGWIAICGVPFLSGAFSKDAILEAAFYDGFATVNGTDFGRIAGWLGIITAFLTPFYMTRMMLLTFASGKERWREIESHAEHDLDHAHDEHHAHGHDHAHEHSHGPDVYGFFYTDEEMAAREEHHDHHHHLDAEHKPHEVPISMWLPLAILAVPSAAAGFFFHQHEMFKSWLLNAKGEAVSHAEEHAAILGSFDVEKVATACAFAGILVGFIMYFRNLPASEGWDMSKWGWFRKSARNQFGYDEAMVGAGVDGGGLIGNFSWKTLDAGIIDGVVNDTGKYSKAIGIAFRMLQTGLVRSYALMMLVGVFGILAYAVLKLGGGL